MKRDVIIYNKFLFLIAHGFSYNCIHDENIYYNCNFEKQSYSISISYDFHYEFVDLTIKSGFQILFQTSYADIINCTENNIKEDFATKLKMIYSLPRKSYSLSDKQFNMLLDLYAEYVLNSLNNTGDGSVC